MSCNSHNHHRRSIRLKGYDYTRAGAYFVTICTQEWECSLGHVENATMVLSKYGRIVEHCWYTVSRHFPNVSLDEFVVMPNHVHGIIIIGSGEAFVSKNRKISSNQSRNASPLQPQPPRGTQPGSLGAIIQNFKSVSTRKINRVRRTPGVPVWQRNYYEHIVRNETELNRIRKYIINNPAKWEMDKNNPNHLDRITDHEHRATRAQTNPSNAGRD